MTDRQWICSRCAYVQGQATDGLLTAMPLGWHVTHRPDLSGERTLCPGCTAQLVLWWRIPEPKVAK